MNSIKVAKAEARKNNTVYEGERHDQTFEICFLMRSDKKRNYISSLNPYIGFFGWAVNFLSRSCFFSVDTLIYPLIFPNGEKGFQVGTKFHENCCARDDNPNRVYEDDREQSLRYLRRLSRGNYARKKATERANFQLTFGDDEDEDDDANRLDVVRDQDPEADDDTRNHKVSLRDHAAWVIHERPLVGKGCHHFPPGTKHSALRFQLGHVWQVYLIGFGRL